MRRLLILIPVITAGFFLSSCATPGPPGRIEKYPGMFATLSAAEQKAVREGRIVEGMSKDAAYLAWGRADSVTTGSQNGTPFELWRYTALQPIYSSNLTLGYGFGYGRYGRRYDPAFIGFESGPDYVPVTAAVVRFKNGKVSGWERAR
ncbi:MAG: hypothetical protein V4726_15425 [Verrucomicrobiota bacterium]